jgi:hydrogenase-4 membrane subunit HyfE
MSRFIRSYFIPNVRFLLLLGILLVPLMLFAQATADQAKPPDVNTVLTILTPIIVYLVMKLVAFIMTKIGTQIPSALITAVIVPLLSLGTMYISSWLGGTNPWYLQLILGFGGTFLHELINNFQKPAAPSQ